MKRMSSLANAETSKIITKLKAFPVFSELSLNDIDKLVAHAEIINVPANTLLFSNAMPGTHLYLMLDGYVEVFINEACTKLINIIRNGEIVGEIGVILQEKYGVTAKSRKPSQLLKISGKLYFELFSGSKSLLTLKTAVVKKLRNVNFHLQEERYKYKNLALYFIAANEQLSQVKAIFQQCIVGDKVRVYDQNEFNASKLSSNNFFHQCEDHSGINLFLAEPGNEEWSKAVLTHVEYIYIIVDEAVNFSLPAIINETHHCPCDLVILHTKQRKYIRTQQFYTVPMVTRHHHITGTTQDYQRIYRFMTGQAIGLVISGGGFRGYAFYGLIKALYDLNIPIDCVGGSSVGATVGAVFAISRNWQEFNEIYQQSIEKLKSRRIFKLTLPIASLFSGELITNVLRSCFGSFQIEDLPINFFCIVSNLSQRRKEIKSCGSLWEWLRASISVPGLLPPFEQNGDIYVDGGVCSNLPISDMRNYLNGSGSIIAFDVRNSEFYITKYSCPAIISFKDALWYKLGLTKNKRKLPSVIDVLLESHAITQHIYEANTNTNADIVIAPNTEDLSALNPIKGEPMNLAAYELACKQLNENKQIFAKWQ